MEATAQLLTVLGLVLGTVDYALLIRRRGEARRREAALHAVQLTGLQGLVRVMLAYEA